MHTTANYLSIATKKMLANIILLVIASFQMQAQTIAAWDFAGLSSPATATATTFDANLVISGGGNTIIRGTGATASTASNSFRTQGFQNNGIAVTNTDYFQIQLQAVFGQQVSLNTIDARVAGTATFTAGAGCSNQFAYSLDGTNFTLIGSPSITTVTPTQLPTIDVSTIPALQNVTFSTTIYLRFYASGQTTTGGWGFNSLATAGTPGLSIGGTITTAGPVPTISTTGTPTSVGTVYGTPSGNTSFDVSGTDMTAGITVTAPTGFEVSENAITGFANSIVVGTAGIIPNTTMYLRLAETATVAGSPYTGNVVLSSSGALNVNVATASSTVNPLSITAIGAVAQNKVYEGTTSATITGATPSTSVNGDVITLTGGGNFVTEDVGNTLTVNANLSVAGTNASSYSLTQPLLSADITPLALTIVNATALNKVFDGLDDAVITGILTGVISPDVVGFVGQGQFATSAVGNGIAVTSTSFLTGADAGNYSLTQPTGLFANITNPGLTPQSITFTLNPLATYGDPAITLNGSATSALAVTYMSSNPMVASISGNVLTIHSDGSATITASQPGDNTTWAPALDVVQSITVSKKTLTVLNATGDNKIYDRTTNATFSGLLDGVVGADNVVLANTGTFPQFTIGIALSITSTASISGTDASKYILVQPTGLTADITPKSLTINNPVASNKIFDGTTNATLTGTLTGVIAPDVVFVSLSAQFANAAVANGVVVTSTSTLVGADSANYVLDQPLGLVANIYPVPTLTEDILPQYIQGVNGTNSNRIPYAYRVTISNLLPNATYKYYNTVVIATDASNSSGAGNIIFVNPSGFTRITTPSFSNVAGHNTFVTDASGNYTGWFVTEPSGNATRFVPGNNVFMRIMLNNGEGGNSIASRVTTTNSAKVINLINNAGPNNGTGLYGNSNALAKNFVLAYDNSTGTGRPLSASFVESDGTLNTTANSYASFYSSNVEAVAGAYGLVIPNDNANGVQRLEQRSITDGSLVGCATASAGLWPSGANTANPTGGTTALAITLTDAPLDNCGVTLNLTFFIQGYYAGGQTMNSTLLNQGVSGVSATDCDSVTIALHDATSPFAMVQSFTGMLLTNGTIACSFPGSVSGNSYYIVIRHRNTLETWSANPVTFSGTTNYNFSTAASQAFGDNQMEVETGVFGIFSGDMNSDFAIDGLDYVLLDPDLILGSSGYLITDLNGDGTVDALDYVIFDPNLITGLTVITP